MIPLFRDVPLVLRLYSVGILECSAGVSSKVMFSCSATVPGCSGIPPVFRVPLFRVPVFLVL